MRVALFAAAASSLLSIGITPGVASAAPSTTEPVERPLSSTEVLFTGRSDIIDTEPLTFDAWSPLDSTTGIRVYFLSGTPACYGVRAVTTETADAVTVELQSGLLPEAANRMCTAKAVLGATDIALDAPVGDRQVLTRH
jgi:pectin methylesterase-like acyl-CoA thioesterase